MVNLGGTKKLDFLGTCFGGDGLGHWEKPIGSAQVRAPSRLFGSKFLGNDILYGDEGSALRGSCKR